MMDLTTVNLIVAVVTMTAGVLYLVETILRREVGAGRVWALAFLGGMLTVTAYLFWRAIPEPWVAIAIGNASLVATAGFFWLGSRTFNGRSNRVAGAIAAVFSLITLVATLVPGPSGGDWAGSMPLFLGVATFAALGAVESRRGAMGAMWSSFGFTVMLVAVAAYYFGRAVVFAVDGPEGEVFETWFNSSNTGVVSIVLTLVALTTATMLRSGRVTLRHDATGHVLDVTPDGVLNSASFDAVLPSVAGRARAAEELLGVIALRLDDRSMIGTAFGTGEQEAIVETWKRGVRRYAPTFALVGEATDDVMLVTFGPVSGADARRTASRIQRRVLDDIAARGSAVIPVLGVGVALSEDVGYQPSDLVRSAQDAARRSSTSDDASVIFAEAPASTFSDVRE